VYFYKGMMRTYSCSGIITIEHAHGIRDASFLRCVSKLVAHGLEVKLKDDFELYQMQTALMVLRDIIFFTRPEKDDGVLIDVKLLSGCRRWTAQLIDTICDSHHFIESFGHRNTKTHMRQRKLITAGPLNMPDDVGDIRKQIESKRRESLQGAEHVIVDQRRIEEGADRLCNRVYDDEGHPVLETVDDISHALAFLQLVCGSRLKGVVFVNIFQLDPDPTSDAIQCIRLCKERSQISRVLYNEMYPRKKQKVEERYTETYKPIIPRFFKAKHGVLTLGEAAVFFLALIREVRLSIAQHYPQDSVYEKEFPANLQPIVSDHDAYYGKDLDVKMSKWLTNVGVITRKVFPFTHEGVGSNMLRRLYIVYGHHVFKPDISVLRYAQTLLGHADITTALVYASVSIR
jgi:hypothetical protein